MHGGEDVAHVLGPFHHLRNREGFVVVGFHDFKEVLAANELHDQMSGLALMNEIENARHDGDARERAQYLGLTAKEIEADSEFLGIVAKHVLDGDGSVVMFGVGSKIDSAEASLG